MTLIEARIRRCHEANTAVGTRMRHCESCEVPVGVMTWHEFDAMKTCAICGKPVHVTEIPVEEPEEILNLYQAVMTFDVGKMRLRRAIYEGIIPTVDVSDRCGILMRASDLAKRYEVRA